MKSKTVIIIGSILVLLVVSIALVTLNKKDKKMYIVSFDTQGAATIEKVEVEDGSTVRMPDNPTKEGYLFLGWTLDGQTYDFNTKVTKNITLVAKYQKINEDVKTYYVTFDTDGGTTILRQAIEEGNKVTKPSDPTKSGYKFIGWYVDNEEYNFDTEVTKNLTIKAKWEKTEETKPSNNNTNQNTPAKQKYTVSFNSNGGSSVSSQQVEEGSKVTEPTSPTRSGYNFTGWTLGGNAYDFNSTVTKNITLVATWVAKSNYTVSFNLNGGSGTVPEQSVMDGNTATEPSAPTRSGYNFTGWTLGGNAYNFSTPVTGNVTLVAGWVQKTYTFSYTPLDPLLPTFEQVITIYENGTPITVGSIKAAGQTVSGSNPLLGYTDLNGLNTITIYLIGSSEPLTATKG